MKDIRDPKWILDRRNSGRLFWRRDSGNFTCSETDDSGRNHTSSMNRVKFRCDVEVLEFLKQEYEQWSSSSSSSSSDEFSDEDDCYGFHAARHDKWRKHLWRSKQDEDVATPSTLIVGLLLAVLLLLVLYQWMNEEAT